MIEFKEALTYDDIQLCPAYSDIESRSHCNVKTKVTKKYSIDTPILASPMPTVCEKWMATKLGELGGLGIIHRFNTISEQIKELPPRAFIRAAATGVTGDWYERAQELIHNDTQIILFDVASGHHENVKKAIYKIKSNYPLTDVIAGNVCTKEGAKALCDWGADAIRINVGNGSACTTRIMSSVGVSSVTSLLDCLEGVTEEIPIIADGGIRFPGCVSKALALGASSVMLGSLLAGTKESPGRIYKSVQWPNEQLYKTYQGSASLEHKMTHGLQEKNVEGASKLIPYKGKVERIINDILDGVRSGMSYVGARNLQEFRQNARFVKVTNAGQREAQPHILL